MKLRYNNVIIEKVAKAETCRNRLDLYIASGTVSNTFRYKLEYHLLSS